MAWLRAWLVAAVCVLTLSQAHAITIEASKTDGGNSFLVLHGAFEQGDDEKALIRKAIEADAGVVIFDSPGGNVYAAMRFGRAIRSMGMGTLQTRSLECASACAMAFLGGAKRMAESGSIGVHRSSFAPEMNLSSSAAVAAIQAGTADLITYLVEMGVDPRLMQLALSVDSTDMRYLTSAEMTDYRVTSDGTATSTPNPVTSSFTSPSAPGYGSGASVAAFEEEEEGPEQLASLPSAPAPQPLDPNRPNRLALYRGLDFLGRDIASQSVADAPACAAACMGTNLCKAFTFNTATRQGRGPNCFLKNSQGDLDGNAVAISGLLLGRMEPDAVSMSFGIIDPARNLYEDADATGGDLSRKPLAGAETAFDCRMACVNNGSCAGFSFVETKKQCWLKAEVGTLRKRLGVVSGMKTGMSYTPTHVPLD